MLFQTILCVIYLSENVRMTVKYLNSDTRFFGSRVGAVVRALAFHQCVPGSIPGPGVICGLSLLVLYSAPRGFSSGYSGFPLSSKGNICLFDLLDLIYLIYSLPNK